MVSQERGSCWCKLILKVDQNKGGYKRNWCLYKDVDLGVATKAELTQCRVSDCEKLTLHMDCVQFMSAMGARILLAVSNTTLLFLLKVFTSHGTFSLLLQLWRKCNI